MTGLKTGHYMVLFLGLVRGTDEYDESTGCIEIGDECCGVRGYYAAAFRQICGSKFDRSNTNSSDIANYRKDF